MNKKNVIRRVLLMALIVLFIPVSKNTTYAETQNQRVHTIYWEAKLNADIVKKKEIILHKDSSVVVVKRNYFNGKSVVRYPGGTVKIPNRYLTFVRDLCTGAQGDYSRRTKESFVNEKKKYGSKTKYLIWVSLDKQRVNVFIGSRRKWRLVKVFKCSSGLPETPTHAGVFRCDLVVKWFKGCQYFVEFGGSGIHKWAGSDKKDLYKIGKHTASQSCVRVRKKNARWLFKHIPVNTKIVIW